jgi:Holliday junction resolvase
MNVKSDVKAKKAYIEYLNKKGYTNCRIEASPADVIAEKNGQTFYFEIKKTTKTDNYFGAATLTEWAQAIKTPDHYRFVIAKTDETEEEFSFIELTPAEMMEYSTIPPFKVYFNIDLNNDKGSRKRRSAIQLTIERIEKLIKAYESLRDDTQA